MSHASLPAAARRIVCIANSLPAAHWAPLHAFSGARQFFCVSGGHVGGGALAGVTLHQQHQRKLLQLQDQQRRLSAYHLPESVDEFEGTDEEEGDYEGQVDPLPDRIGFLGAGQMGEAMLKGFFAAGISAPDRVDAAVRSAERHAAMTRLGVTVLPCALAGGAKAIAESSEIIFLGVKPPYIPGILEALAPHVGPQHLVVSIAAGIKIAALEKALPGARIVRVMPNTPCTIRQAATAYVLGSTASEADGRKVHALMSAVGLAIPVEERMMDAVTALSGSGPAYVFLAIEALADGGVAAGLPRDKALALAAQTVVGAGRMIFERQADGHTLTHPATLKDRVTSPGGTTIAGLIELEVGGVRGALIKAVKAAAERSKELGA